MSKYIQLILAGILSLMLLVIGGCQQSVDRGNSPIKLTLWHCINPPPNRDVFQKLVDKFNQKNPDIQVESLYIGQADQVMPKILTAVIGNASPDILWYDPSITGRLVELQAIQPIEEWLNESPLKSQIDPVLLETMVLNNHTWSIPFYTNNVGIFYRPSLFKSAGINTLPTNWQELRAVAKKLTVDKNRDGQKDQYGMLLPLGKGEWTVFTWLPFMFSSQGELLEDNKPTLNNEGALIALNFWATLLKDGSAINSLPERGYEQDAFIAGKVAMQLTGPWTLNYLNSTGVDYGVMPIPINQKAATSMGGANLFVMKTKPKREQAALKFLEYVLSEDFQVQQAIGTGGLPINIKSQENKLYQEYVAKQPTLKVFLEQMAVSRSRPIVPQYYRLAQSIGEAIEATLLGKSPQKALEKAQQRAELAWNN